MSNSAQPIRLLVVDDSAFNRRNIADVFADVDDVEVVGKAGDGEEALKLATALKPDVITLDLEMPRMDGFTFLRILMVRQPTPVVVVSSYAQRENVFKALELGAVDFVTKPDRQLSPDATEVREEILAKVLMVRSLQKSQLVRAGAGRITGGFRSAPGGVSAAVSATDASSPVAVDVPYRAPKRLVAIASSTGGPSALLTIFGQIPQGSSTGFVIAQHMPDKFTRTFAERLDRKGNVRFAEAQDGDAVSQNTGFVCPGRRCMQVVSLGKELRVKVTTPAMSDRYVPSADRLFQSVASVAGAQSIAVILTGMGDDAVEGARAIRDAGGRVIAESKETAVVYGMPGAVVRAGLAHDEWPLPKIAQFLADLPH